MLNGKQKAIQSDNQGLVGMQKEENTNFSLKIDAWNKN